MMNADVQRVLDKGWVISRGSCACGGQFAWLKPRSSGAYEMVGCVCHTKLPAEINIDIELHAVGQQASGKTFTLSKIKKIFAGQEGIKIDDLTENGHTIRVRGIYHESK